MTFRRIWHRSQLCLRLSFNTCRFAYSGERIALQRIGLPVILTRCVAGDVGYKQRTSIKDVELVNMLNRTLVWIETSGCLYQDMRSIMTMARRFYSSGGQVCAKKELV